MSASRTTIEHWDVLDGDGNPAGRTHERGRALQPGEYHLVVHIWIRRPSGEYLIQRRADHLELLPGVWATTGGSVVAGEESQTGAVRETVEEVGLVLDPARMERLARRKGRDLFVDIWLAGVDAGADKAVAIGPEVSATRWCTKAEIQAMTADGRFYDYGYIDMLP